MSALLSQAPSELPGYYLAALLPGKNRPNLLDTITTRGKAAEGQVNKEVLGERGYVNKKNRERREVNKEVLG